MSRRTREVVLLVTPLACTVLLLLAARRSGLYRFLVREDSMLEWGQVLAYVAVIGWAFVRAPSLYRHGDRAAAAVLVILAVGAVLVVGEEISWGQRFFDFGTPEVFSRNKQGETNLHNDERLDRIVRAATLLAGLYGLVACLAVRRPTPFAPPRALAGFFAVVAGYFAVRFLFFPEPAYTQAKFSEWPEICLALGTLGWALALAVPGGPRWRPAPNASD